MEAADWSVALWGDVRSGTSLIGRLLDDLSAATLGSPLSLGRAAAVVTTSSRSLSAPTMPVFLIYRHIFLYFKHISYESNYCICYYSGSALQSTCYR